MMFFTALRVGNNSLIFLRCSKFRLGDNPDIISSNLDVSSFLFDTVKKPLLSNSPILLKSTWPSLSIKMISFSKNCHSSNMLIPSVNIISLALHISA